MTVSTPPKPQATTDWTDLLTAGVVVIHTICAPVYAPEFGGSPSQRGLTSCLLLAAGFVTHASVKIACDLSAETWRKKQLRQAAERQKSQG